MIRPAYILVALALLACAITLTPRSLAQGERRRFEPRPALERLRRARGQVKARLDDASGGVRYIGGSLAASRPGDAEPAARDFFARHGDLFSLDPALDELRTVATTRDERGNAGARFEQWVGGVRVWGSDIRAEMDRAGVLHTVHGSIVPGPRPPRLAPRIAAERAEAIARATIDASSRREQAPELVVARLDGRDYLAWHIRAQTAEPGRWQILVDALTGRVLDRHDILASGKQRRTYSAANDNVLPGQILRREEQPASGDAHADAAHDNAGRVYDYFWQAFGRDSLDGDGMAIESSVHYGRSYANAYWNGWQVVYGDGDGEQFGPLGFGLDVVAHELTHGIIERTAGLAYRNQSGALNEAFADIFAAFVDTTNWEIGESIYTPRIEGDAIRSLADPGLYGQPRTWAEYLRLPPTSAGDNGGVHVNTGIISHVAYRASITIGREKLGHIFYRTLTTKLTSGSDFMDARDLTLQSCEELVGVHGINASDCGLVQTAFADAGLGDFPSTSTPMPHQSFLPLVARGTAACGDDLVRNGDFEAGQRFWPNVGGVLQEWPDPRGRNRSAKLEVVDQMLQVIALPPGARGMLLSVELRGNAGETNGQVRIRLEDVQTHALVGTVVTATGMGGSWQPFNVLLPDLAGHSSLRLVFEHVDETAPLFLDNVRLLPECGGV